MFVACGEVVEVELLLLDEEEGGADADTGVSFTLQLEYVHALIISRGEIVESRGRSHDPIPVRVFARRVDGEAPLHIPKAHRAVLRVGE